MSRNYGEEEGKDQYPQILNLLPANFTFYKFKIKYSSSSNYGGGGEKAINYRRNVSPTISTRNSLPILKTALTTRLFILIAVYIGLTESV